MMTHRISDKLGCFCSHCGTRHHVSPQHDGELIKCGYCNEMFTIAFSLHPPQQTTAVIPSYVLWPKKKRTAIALAMVFGIFGFHRFYLGETVVGLAYLLLTLLFWWTLYVPLGLFLCAWVETLIYLATSDAQWSAIYGGPVVHVPPQNAE